MALPTTQGLTTQLQNESVRNQPTTPMDGNVTRPMLIADLLKAMRDVNFSQLIEEYGSMAGMKNEKDTSVDTFMKGGLSGCVSWAFIYPADYIKTIVQHKNISYSLAINQLIKSKNPLVLYSGVSLAMLRCFPLHGGVFLGYKLCNEL